MKQKTHFRNTKHAKINLFRLVENLAFALACTLAKPFIKHSNLWLLFQNFITVLSLFTVVTWGQGQCTAPSGEFGSCVPNNECVPRGGIPGGPCASGYGMCCVCMFTEIFLSSDKIYSSKYSTIF